MCHNYIDMVEFTIKEQDIASSNYQPEEYVALYDSRDMSSNDIIRIIENAASNSSYRFEFPIRSDCVFMSQKAFERVFRSLFNK